jgi:hypothetical protein
MFILDQDPTFKLKVSLWRPGAKQPTALTLVAKPKDQDDLLEWANRVGSVASGDARYLMEAIVGWEDVAGRDRKPVEFSEEEFDRLLRNFPGIGLVIFKTYLEELKVEREKN